MSHTAIRRHRRRIRPVVESLDGRRLLSGSWGLTPDQVRAAYGLDGIAFTTASGATVRAEGIGETIALIEMYHDPNLASDLHAFDQQFGLPDPTLQVVNQAGNQVDSGWTQEESLDVEWAHAIAPGARILVVEAAPGYRGQQAFQNLMKAVQTASTPSTAGKLGLPPVAAVSMSWGFDEFQGETQYDSSFTTPGITYIAASGDSPGLEYPAASPDVLAVGGTSLNLGPTGSYGSETAWYSSGGGYSQYESEPSYQESYQTSGRRSTPDVAFDANPSTGAAVYYSEPDGNEMWGSGAPQGSWTTVGGTSLGAPSWAGIVAIIDQGRHAAGLPNLSGATQTLPSLYHLSSESATASDFHAITPNPYGTSRGGGEFFGGRDGLVGLSWAWSGGNPTGTSTSDSSANTQTGLGSPDGLSLIHDLSVSTTTAPVPTPSPSPSPSPPSPPPISTPGSTPTPTPTTTPAGGKHHPRHKATQKKAHVAATHSGKLVKQERPAVKGPRRRHHPA